MGKHAIFSHTFLGLQILVLSVHWWSHGKKVWGRCIDHTRINVKLKGALLLSQRHFAFSILACVYYHCIPVVKSDPIVIDGKK
jgi:hypothetical protein